MKNLEDMIMSTNSKYYAEHANEFIDGTINCDMSVQYNFFEKYLSKAAKRIMDLGFGSGRDSLYFKSKGYKVTSIDPTKEFCKNAEKLGLEDVRCITAQKIDDCNEYDGIWACASLLHVPSVELNDVFKRCYKSLKKNGIMYCSFKYGEFEGIRKERFFVDLNEQSFKEYIKDTGFVIKEMLITKDVRPDRTESWLNVILEK
jgi:SAM-dependent methyltransferase